MPQRTTKGRITAQAERLGLTVRIWSPGDRLGTRYEFYAHELCISPVLCGAGMADSFLAGYAAGHQQGE